MLNVYWVRLISNIIFISRIPGNKLKLFISAREVISVILHYALVLLFFVDFYMLINLLQFFLNVTTIDIILRINEMDHFMPQIKDI